MEKSRCSGNNHQSQSVVFEATNTLKRRDPDITMNNLEQEISKCMRNDKGKSNMLALLACLIDQLMKLLSGAVYLDDGTQREVIGWTLGYLALRHGRDRVHGCHLSKREGASIGAENPVGIDEIMLEVGNSRDVEGHVECSWWLATRRLLRGWGGRHLMLIHGDKSAPNRH
jgi:hypothetical protein